MTFLYPAIDLLGGRCVRLRQGDYEQVTHFDSDPVLEAEEFVAAGASWVHLVDLDAARTGEPVNREVIARVVSCLPATRVQVGGGVRSLEAARALAELGVSRVVVGTMAAEDPELTARIAAEQPVALGLDVRGGEVAVRGWTEGSGRSLSEVLDAYRGVPGIEAVVVTVIERDGTGEGPDLDVYRSVLAEAPPEMGVIASGGVGSVEHLRALAGLEVKGRFLEGAIVGIALHDGRIRCVDALAALEAGR